jgi:hypothetical protein
MNTTKGSTFVRYLLPVGLGVLAAAVGITSAFVLRTTDPEHRGTNALRTDTPEHLVSSYFAALEAGDADAARSLGQTSVDHPLLTDDWLRAQARVGAISDVSIQGVDAGTGPTRRVVRVAYTVGTEPVNDKLHVVQSSAGTGQPVHWMLEHAAAAILIDSNKVDLQGQLTYFGLPVPARAAAFEVFPGAALFALTTKRLVIANPVATVRLIDDFSDLSVGVLPSDSAKKEVLTAVSAAFDTCLASHDVTTACGLTLPVSAKPAAGSVKYSVTTPPDYSFSENGVGGPVALTRVNYTFTATWRDSVSGVDASVPATEVTATAHTDVSKTPLVVVW